MRFPSITRETRGRFGDGFGARGMIVFSPAQIESSTPLRPIGLPVPPITFNPPASTGGGATASSMFDISLGTTRGAITWPSDDTLLVLGCVLRAPVGAGGGGVGATSADINCNCGRPSV